MRYHITIENSAESFRCSEDQTLLRGMESLGKRGIPVGCRGGGCGVCKIQVTSGTYLKKKMNRTVISEVDESNHVVLACRCVPTSDISLSVVGKMEKSLFAQQTVDPSKGSVLSQSSDLSVRRAP